MVRHRPRGLRQHRSDAYALDAVRYRSVIFAAVFVQLAQARRSWGLDARRGVHAINLATALGNVASMSDETRDGRSSSIERKKQVDDKRKGLNDARKVQVELAGEVPAQTIEGNLQALIASDAPRWTASEHCNPDKITLQATRTLCDQIAKLEAKKAAALKRDEIDVKLAEVDRETVFGGPSSADPYAESLARLLSVFRFEVSDEGKALLSSSKDWGKAIGLELMAAFGPMALDAAFRNAAWRASGRSGIGRGPRICRAQGRIGAIDPLVRCSSSSG